MTDEQREKVIRIVDLNTTVALAKLVKEQSEEFSQFYRMEQKNAFRRMLRNIEIMFGVNRMGKEDKAYAESLKDTLRDDFILEFKRQYRKEVEKALGYE